MSKAYALQREDGLYFAGPSRGPRNLLSDQWTEDLQQATVFPESVLEFGYSLRWPTESLRVIAGEWIRVEGAIAEPQFSEDEIRQMVKDIAREASSFDDVMRRSLWAFGWEESWTRDAFENNGVKVQWHALCGRSPSAFMRMMSEAGHRGIGELAVKAWRQAPLFVKLASCQSVGAP